MIDCGNNKFIFTQKKNLNYIAEFANKFNLKIHYAKVSSEFIVGLDEVANKFCDQGYFGTDKFKIIQKNVLGKKETRTMITEKAQKIRKQMIDFILKQKKVTFKQIQDKFQKENISISALCNHFSQVRRELASKGIHIIKIKNGLYSI